MSTAVVTESRIDRVVVSDRTITAYLTDGRVISVPLTWSWRLSDATPAQRANWKLMGNGTGVHWPDIDEDISAEGMLTGIPARRPRSAQPAELATVAAKRARARRATKRARCEPRQDETRGPALLRVLFTLAAHDASCRVR
jgi:hypothetical protein